ncbi:MAG: hypothetical protein AAGK04_14495, partial [Planctomycetota bacterium]
MRRLIPSMFHRRLLLVAIVGVLGVLPLAGQLVRLTLAQGAGLRAEAEGKLQRSEWLPTRRGRIIDRHARVLATDRASYAVSVSYPVITGEWATRRAGRYARRAHRDTWPKLSAVQREALIDRYLPVYQSHLNEAWDRFATLAGVSRARLDRRREHVQSSVERMFGSIVDRRLRLARAEQLARGQEITAEIEERLQGLARRPIREQTSGHVLAPRVPDEMSFAFRRLAAERIELRPAGDDGPADTVERVPGLE